MIDFYFQYLIRFTGGVAGIYLLGVFTVRGNSAGAWVGFFAAGAAIYLVKFHTDAIHFHLRSHRHRVGGFTGYGASLLLKRTPKSLDGLTFHT